MHLLKCAAAIGAPDTRMEHSAPANREDKPDIHDPSPTTATAAECARRKAPHDAIPVEAQTVVYRIELRRLRQSHSKEPFVFCRVRTYWKMWSPRSSPARLPIRYLFWPACFWKKNDTATTEIYTLSLASRSRWSPYH